MTNTDSTPEKRLPTQFRDLGVAELRRSAVEDFAVDVKQTDNKEAALAALTEAGVTWADYVQQHPEVAPAPVVVDKQKTPANVITNPNAGDPANLTVGGTTEEAPVQPVVRVQEPVKVTPTDKYLVKMTRDNPRFDTRGYTFTQAHPYALVDGKDLEYILTKEDGFRQALPSELQEFYG